MASNQKVSSHPKNYSYSPPKSKNDWGRTAIDTGTDVLAGLAGAGIGAAMGKYSLLAGIPALIIANKTKRPLIAIAAMGCILANGFQATNAISKPASGLDGQDEVYGLEGGLNPMAAIKGASTRVGNYFRGFGKKLLIPGLSGSDIAEIAGLGSMDDQTMSYHQNPIGNAPDEPVGILGNVGFGGFGSVGQAGEQRQIQVM